MADTDPAALRALAAEMRRFAPYMIGIVHSDELTAALDAAAEAQERLAAERDEALNGIGQQFEYAAQQHDRAAAAEAEAGRLREALRALVDSGHSGVTWRYPDHSDSPGGCVYCAALSFRADDDAKHAPNCPITRARAALAAQQQQAPGGEAGGGDTGRSGTRVTERGDS